MELGGAARCTPARPFDQRSCQNLLQSASCRACQGNSAERGGRFLRVALPALEKVLLELLHGFARIRAELVLGPAMGTEIGIGSSATVTQAGEVGEARAAYQQVNKLHNQTSHAATDVDLELAGH